MSNVSAILRVVLPAMAVMFVAVASGQRQSSRRGKLKPSDVVSERGAQSAPFDTVAVPDGMVRFSGYEKSLRATRETVFISNLSAREVARVAFRVTYYDVQGRQIHVARHNIYAPVPPGETRRLDFPTWDRQYTFYYVGSPRPRVSATPYSVRIHPDTLFFVNER